MKRTEGDRVSYSCTVSCAALVALAVWVIFLLLCLVLLVKGGPR